VVKNEIAAASAGLPEPQLSLPLENQAIVDKIIDAAR